MSINKLISASNILTQFAEETDPALLNMKPVLVRWIKQADLRISALEGLKAKYYRLDLTVGSGNVPRAPLPLAAVHIDGLLIGDYLDRCPDVFNTIKAYTETEGTYFGESIVWKWSTNEEMLCHKVAWQVIDNNIEFQSNFNSSYVTAKILCYEEDANGYPMINENHVEAISAFLLAKWMMKQRFTRFRMGKWSRVDQETLNSVKSEFINLARLARANDENYRSDLESESADISNEPFSGNSWLNIY